jgi:23S rRNA pseudouridine1911/1915/1917 synthase
MKKDKAYKVLAKQLGISNSKAKHLIDTGVVYLKGRRVNIARAEVNANTRFVVKRIEEPRIIFEDKNLLAVNKPPFVDSYELERIFKYKLLHRLDKETSGIILLWKNREFYERAIEEFKNRKVYKEYTAILCGIVAEPIMVNRNLLKTSKGTVKVDRKGKEAITHFEPISLVGRKKTRVKVTIETGRLHQIRAHARYIKAPILGDTVYGGAPFERVMLHAKRIEIFDYKFEVKEPEIFFKEGI